MSDGTEGGWTGPGRWYPQREVIVHRIDTQTMAADALVYAPLWGGLIVVPLGAVGMYGVAALAFGVVALSLMISDYRTLSSRGAAVPSVVWMLLGPLGYIPARDITLGDPWKLRAGILAGGVAFWFLVVFGIQMGGAALGMIVAIGQCLWFGKCG